MLRLKPVHDALREALSRANIRALAKVADQLGAPRLDSETWEAIDLVQLDQLRAISEKSRHLFAEIAARIPPSSSEVDSSKSARAVRTPQSNPSAGFLDSLRNSLALAAHLPALCESFSTDWPAKSRPILPTTDAATDTDSTWAPILAYLVLRAMHERLGDTPLDLPALFDRLLFRRALADIFAGFGLQGEARWQAAAQVRLLLTAAANAPNAIQTAALFADPDARWLAGVHDSGSTTYFNKEQFEELATWLQLPTLLEIAELSGESARVARVTRLQGAVAAAYTAARDSGYRLTGYLAAFSAPKPEPAAL
jgi:hypothetical protein